MRYAQFMMELCAQYEGGDAVVLLCRCRAHRLSRASAHFPSCMPYVSRAYKFINVALITQLLRLLMMITRTRGMPDVTRCWHTAPQYNVYSTTLPRCSSIQIYTNYICNIVRVTCIVHVLFTCERTREYKQYQREFNAGDPDGHRRVCLYDLL